jgi:hypothetical protein
VTEIPRRRTPHAPELDGATWFKSSYSAGEQSCVEVADIRGAVYGAIAVRDSKHPERPALFITPSAFAQFTQNAAQSRYGV